MTRIAYVTAQQMTEQARELTLERGELNVYRVLANARNMFTGWMVAGRAALTSPILPARLRELVILRTGYLMDCPYEIAQHTTTARAAGINAHEIAALAADSGSDTADFTLLEHAVLRLTTKLLTARSVDPALFDEVHNALGAEATIEVLMLINRWAGLALMLNALEVDLDESACLSIPTTQGGRA